MDFNCYLLLKCQSLRATFNRLGDVMSKRVTLKLRHNAENDENGVVCVRIRPIFGLTIEEITSTFDGGIPSGKSVVKLSEFHVDIYLDVDGIPNGPFRVWKDVPRMIDGRKALSRVNDSVHFGRFKNGQVVENCWIASSDQVILYFLRSVKKVPFLFITFEKLRKFR
jgi:hypothetical protein